MKLEQTASGIYHVTLKPSWVYGWDSTGCEIKTKRKVPKIENPWNNIIGYLGRVTDSELIMEMGSQVQIFRGGRVNINTPWSRMASLERLGDLGSWEDYNNLVTRLKNPNNYQPTTTSEEATFCVLSSEKSILYSGNDLTEATRIAEDYVESTQHSADLFSAIKRKNKDLEVRRTEYYFGYNPEKVPTTYTDKKGKVVLPKLALDELAILQG